jgi:hypothetical protein
VDDHWGDDEAEPRHDRVVDDACVAISERVRDAADAVFYSRQLEVWLERKFFHWITNKALRVLIARRELVVEEVPLGEKTRIRFVFRRGLRYRRRAIGRSAVLIRRYSDHTFTAACGEQADMLFLNAFARNGFRCLGEDVNDFQGRKWTQSEHNLDFIIEKEGVVYGAEVKNTLDYIDREELRTKVAICEHLGVRPLMIMRAAPKTYVHEDVIQHGGLRHALRHSDLPLRLRCVG